MKNFLAIDLGASNGRVLLGRWDGARFHLNEVHRFDNGPVTVMGHKHWDVLRLWGNIKTGLARYAAEYKEPPAAIGVDTWGVDFGLLDGAGRLLGNPYHYRDSQTDGVMEKLFRKVPAEQVFGETGIQFMQFNSIFQLYAMVLRCDPQLAVARRLLFMPDLFHYWLTGVQAGEYTIATTSQMLSASKRQWASKMLGDIGIPGPILPDIIRPGTVLGSLLGSVADGCGITGATPVVATGSHDTASAVAAIPGLDERSVYISSGTWSLMGMEVREPIINERTRGFNVTNEGGVYGTIRLLKNIAGLWLVQESRHRWQRDGQDFSWEELARMAEEAAPFGSLVDPDAPDFLNPPDMPEAIRSFCRRTGQKEPATPGEVVRCCLESLALKYRLVLQTLAQLTGSPIESVRVVGGGCRNRLLCRFTAEACGRPVITGPVEATALGNLMVQAIALGELSDLESGRKAIAGSVEQEYFQPTGDQDWDEAYDRFRALVG